MYFCLEKDIRKYSELHNFKVLYDRCPCIIDSYRNKIRDILNKMPEQVKINIVENFLKMLPKLKAKFSKGDILSCGVCGEPSSSTVCTTCKIMDNLKK